MIIRKSLSCSTFLFLFFAISSNAAQADLDTSFNGNGFVVGPATGYGPRAILTQPDGKIVVGGFSGSPEGFAVFRYTQSGTLDPTFNGTGSIIIEGLNQIRSMALQLDGKIVAVGETFSSGSQDFAIVRINSNGTPDSTFGSQGVKVVSLSTDFTDGASGVAIQIDGKIVVCGYVDEIPGGNNIAVVRLTTSGELDKSFSGDGIVTTNINATDSGDAVALQNDGKIVVAGRAANPNLLAVVRYETNGSLDSSFDGDGIFTTDIGPTSPFSVVVDQQQRILVGGGGRLNVGGTLRTHYAMLRLTTTGNPDSSFDGDGRVFTSFLEPAPQTVSAIGKYVRIKPNGKIMLSGFLIGSTQADRLFAIAQYTPGGQLDSAFDNDGMRTYNLDDPNEMYGIDFQLDGKIVVLGASSQTWVLFRLLGEPAGNIFDFDGDSRSDISVFRPSSGEWWTLRSSDSGNQTVTFGTASDQLVPADFTGDWKYDAAFYRNGEWFVLRSDDYSFYSFPFGNSADIPAPADYDGDGKDDPAVFRPSTGTWYVLRSWDGSTLIASFGGNGDRPVPADYDGDSKADLAIYRPNGGSGGEWWYLRSSDGANRAFQFGSATDKTVQGDYTGDGKADLAFFRPSSGEWFILRSEDSSFYSFPFGLGTDTPAPGDYDGDGKIDATVFRDSNTTWYANGSTAGTVITAFGSSGDRPVPNAFVR